MADPTITRLAEEAGWKEALMDDLVKIMEAPLRELIEEAIESKPISRFHIAKGLLRE